jgi:hypothetical protein
MRTSVALLLVAALVGGCATDTRAGAPTFEIEKGVFKWVSADSAPNQSWVRRGKLEVTLLDGYVKVVHRVDGSSVIVPSQRVLYIGDGTDPDAWD